MGFQYTVVQHPWSMRDVYFIGGMSTRIAYNHTKWTITDSVSNITAETNAKKDSYVLGKHKWTIVGDNDNCGDGEDYSILLKFSGCKDGEFTCDDGQCVRMEERCDQLADCRDKSDEMQCKLVVLEEGYNKRVPPITAASALDRTIVPVTVNVSMVLMAVVSIDEVDHSIELQFEIILQCTKGHNTALSQYFTS